MIWTIKNYSTQNKTCTNATLSTTNPTWTVLESNARICCEMKINLNYISRISSFDTVNTHCLERKNQSLKLYMETRIISKVRKRVHAWVMHFMANSSSDSNLHHDCHWQLWHSRFRFCKKWHAFPEPPPPPYAGTHTSGPTCTSPIQPAIPLYQQSYIQIAFCSLDVAFFF
jgi:hypothetical protein